MKRVSEIVNQLKKRTRYLVWLDYDYPLDGSVLQDIYGFLRVLAPGSILLITVDAEPKLPNRADNRKFGEFERLQRLLSLLQQELSPYYSRDITAGDLTARELPKLFANILRSHIASSLSGRERVNFHQLVNCVYADGANMLTFGGLLDEPSAAARLAAGGVYNEFATSAEVPIEISVPPLTIREKLWLDQHMSLSTDSRQFRFELDDYLVANYRRFYKQYPLYHEALM
jgi:hypothetical protein